MQSGQLLVVLKGSASISLKSYPAALVVEFIDVPEPVPCNPGNFDSVQYQADVSANGTVVLTITWAVSVLRSLVWTAYY
jgi:hypothetical protein